MNYCVAIMGPDNIGKTYLVSELVREYVEAITSHFGGVKTKSEGKKSMIDFLEEFERVDNKLFILDRCPLGDFVYGPLFRGYDAYSYFDEIKTKLDSIKNTKFLFIVLCANENTYYKFDIPKKDDEKKKYQKREQSETISHQFEQLVNKLEGKHDIAIFDTNLYSSLDMRNFYVKRRIKIFLEGDER